MLTNDTYFCTFNAVCNLGGFFSIGTGEHWSIYPHTFEQCKFYYVTEGACVITVEDTEYTAKAGDWFFIPAGTRHAYRNISTAPFQKYWMHFDLYPDTELFSYLSLPFFVHAGTKGKVKELFHRFAEARHHGSLADSLTVKACLIELLAEYIRLAAADRERARIKQSERLERLLRYIRENLDKPLSNAMLAEIYFTHPTHFVRAFREETGQTPARYIRNLRLETAKRLLEETTLSAAETAARVGFPDPAHFSRIFRQRYGMSPAVWRAYFKKSLTI